MLYEPTNITPSTITQTGTVSAAENVNIQWQVNGNSAMSMFQIDVYTNDAQSTLVYSTGVISQTPQPTNPDIPYTSLPFYGKDNMGNYLTFVYYPAADWGEGGSNTTNWGLQDGNSYKFVITQFYNAQSINYSLSLNYTLSINSNYYFSYVFNGTTYYVSFSTQSSSTYFQQNCIIYISCTNQTIWIKGITNNNRVETNITFAITQTQPQTGTNLNRTAQAIQNSDLFYNAYFTQQIAASAIILRTTPTLTIAPFSNPLSASVQTFTATYAQAQGDAIQSVNWLLYEGENLTLIDTTGEISTSVLEYSYAQFQNNQTYQIKCVVVTQNNVEVSATQNFSVVYSQQTYSGDFTVVPICQENSNLLSWDLLTNIAGTATPENGYIISNGILSLSAGASISWSSIKSNDVSSDVLNFLSPWTLVWKGDLNQPYEIAQNFNAINGEVNSIAFSPDGSLFAIGGGNYAYLYSVNNQTISQGQSIINNSPYYYTVYDMAFSADSSRLIIVGNNLVSSSSSSATASIVGTISSSQITNLSNFVSGNIITGVQFNNQKTLIALNQDSSHVYTYTNNTLGNYPYTFDIGATFTAAAFSPNGSLLVLSQSNLVYVYQASNLLPVMNNHIATITRGDNTINGAVTTMAFSPDGSLFVIGGAFSSGYASLFTVSGQTFTYVGDIKRNNVALNGAVTTMAFSPDGSLFVIGGEFSGYASVFTVSGQTLTYVGDIKRNNVALNGAVNTMAFSPNGNLFVIGGAFSDYVSVFDSSQGFSSVLCAVNSQKISIVNTLQTIQIKENTNVLQNIFFNTAIVPALQLVAALTPTAAYCYCFNGTSYLGVHQASLNNYQETIENITILGPQNCDYLAAFAGDGSDVLPNLSNLNFVPQWNNTNYTLQFFANFNYGIDAGTGSSSGNGFYLYRRAVDENISTPVGTFSSTTNIIKDYGIKSGKSYIYDFYVYDNSDAFMGVRSNSESPVSQIFNKYSLLVTEYNQSDNCYHVVKEYQFSCNIQDMTISNNSNKSYVQNFTPYPTVFMSTANYASGTLQALIGFVDYKSYQYWDSTELMNELNALSTTDYTLFLRDMKGHLWMVDVGTVQQTVTQKTAQMQVTISLPWTEIGSAESVSIIQTPADEGWNYDAQVLDVQLNVDVNNGVLYATYPYPYNGTAFYLIGVTPEGVTSIVQPLSDSSDTATAGQLTAILKNIKL